VAFNTPIFWVYLFYVAKVPFTGAQELHPTWSEIHSHSSSISFLVQFHQQDLDPTDSCRGEYLGFIPKTTFADH
jgi:hypothetical protein